MDEDWQMLFNVKKCKTVNIGFNLYIGWSIIWHKLNL